MYVCDKCKSYAFSTFDHPEKCLNCGAEGTSMLAADDNYFRELDKPAPQQENTQEDTGLGLSGMAANPQMQAQKIV